MVTHVHIHEMKLAHTSSNLCGWDDTPQRHMILKQDHDLVSQSRFSFNSELIQDIKQWINSDY